MSSRLCLLSHALFDPRDGGGLAKTVSGSDQEAFVYRIDSIGIFEGADNTWLMEANFLGYEGRRVYGVLLHFQVDGLTEIRPKMARVSDRQVVRPATGGMSLPGTPEALRRQVAAVLEALGWGPEATTPAMASLEAWPPARRPGK